MSKEREKGREGEKEDREEEEEEEEDAGAIQGEWRRKVIDGGGRRKDEGERRS